MVKGGCNIFSPVIIDTDGALRWVGTAGHGRPVPATFFDNAVYLATGPRLFRIDLDGTVTVLGDYSNIGVANFNHNIDRGKVGIILEADTAAYFESLNIEMDASGKGFEGLELGQHYQRSHESWRRRSQPVRLSGADRLVPWQQRYL